MTVVAFFFPCAACLAQERVQAEESFPWGIHLIAVPLILIFGIFIGWSLRERKQAQDDTRKELTQKS